MHNLLRFDAVKSQRQVTSTVKGASVQVCGLQRTSCLRGSNVPIGPRPVVCHAGESQDPQRVDKEDLDIQGGAESMDHGLNSQPPFNARWEHDFHPEKLAVPINESSAISGMEAGEAQLAWSPSPSLNPQDSHYSIDPKGWYECRLFDVLQGAHIDAQAASHFFSHLAVHDSWASPLTMDELLHTVRIADITGFTLPPVIVAQLHNLVQSSGPQASQSSADPMLAAYAYDLPALLDMLQGMEVTPSVAWTDYALHAWLTAVGSGAGGQLSAAHVRSVMTMLEAMYIPGTEPSVGPQTPLPSAPQSQGREPGAVPTLGSGAMGRGTTAMIATPSAGSVRGWLDACLTAMLDSGALRHAHQREDLYEMLPHLATAPSAAMVEQLYDEAWLTYYAPGGAASSEYIASMLWLIAASGAKLPPAVVQGELRALEGAILRIALNDSSTGGIGARGSDGGEGPSSSSGNTADIADPRAVAAAALKAAFALPSSPGASDRAASSSPPPPSSLKASAAPSPLESFKSPPLNGDPPPLQLPPPLLSRPGSGRRISPFGAYLALWAFHHYHYIPHATSARVVGPILLAAAVSAGGGGAGRGLEPRQRCRVVRAVLMCFGSVPPQLFAKHDWSSLFRGWEILGKGELLPLLQDAAALAHQRRRLRRRRGSDGVQEDGGAQLLPLSHLVAHVVQLAGWQRRLEHVGLSVAITSLAGLLAVLSDEVGDTAGHDAASESRTPPDTTFVAEARNDVEDVVAGEGSFMYSNDGDGGGGSVSAQDILASPFAQGLLANWLGLVLPEIQDAVKHLTGDWGNAGRAAGGGGGHRAGAAAAAATAPGGQKQHWDPSHQDPQSGRGLHGVGDGAVSGGAVWHSELSRPLGSVAVSAAAGPADAGHNSGTLSRRSLPGLPPPVTAETVLAQRPPPPLMATELTWMLMVLRNTAAALDPRCYPTLHRTLMWAMQRLGSRAGKCAVEPEAFAFVPGMLVQMDTLGWVDVPLEWAHAVVEYPDAEGAWFRRLPWHEAMRAVLGSGQLVKRARAEVLRYHGAEATVTIMMNSEASEPQQSREHQHPQQLPGDPPAEVLELDSDSGRDHVAAAAESPLSAGPRKPRPSKAAALLAAAQRLRSHLMGLMSARMAACGVMELRQVALTWQMYGMTYDKKVLEVLVGALAAALANGDRGNAAAVTALTLGAVHDAAARLEMICAAQQVGEEEIRCLFRPLRVYML